MVNFKTKTITSQLLHSLMSNAESGEAFNGKDLMGSDGKMIALCIMHARYAMVAPDATRHVKVLPPLADAEHGTSTSTTCQAETRRKIKRTLE